MGLDRAVLLRPRARNAERFHAVGQSGRLEPEKPSRAIAAVDFPTRPGDRPLDILALEANGDASNKVRLGSSNPQPSEPRMRTRISGGVAGE